MKFTIVTPSFNQGDYLAETLASVRAAASRLAPDIKVEHWIIDGGSTDRSVQILNEQTFAKWISESDNGQTDAINKGLDRATGDIISVLCSDDLLEENALELVAARFRQEPAADLVYGDYYFLEGETGWKRAKFARDFSVESLRQDNFLSHPAVFMHRRVVEQFGQFDRNLRYCMDHEYWLRICATTQWSYLRAPLASMRLHADAKSSAQLAPAWWETASMAKRYGLGRRFWWKAFWIQIAGQYSYRIRRKLYRRLGALKSRGTSAR